VTVSLALPGTGAERGESDMPGHVKGVLFADYVRMLRSHRGRTLNEFLLPEDLAYLDQTIDLEAWYPMESFERLGVAIFQAIAEGDLGLVREWGRASVVRVIGANEHVLVRGDPRDSLMRFLVLRRSLFDFEALSVLQLSDSSASIEVEYGMAPLAEQAAAVQTMGFFEGLIELADGGNVQAEFLESSWRGNRQTIIGFSWQPAAAAPAGRPRMRPRENGAILSPPER
jgi:hypothetical protein